MRLVAVGGVITLLSVLGLRTAFRVDGPYREYCSTVSVSPDDRFQVEAWQQTTLDPLSRQLDIFGDSCRHGWLVMRETSTGERVAETEARDLWLFDSYRDSDSDLVTWEPRAALAGARYGTEHRLDLPPGVASISVPAQGRKCDQLGVSPDGRFRLEVWSRHRPLGCIADGGPGEVLLIENGTERVTGKASTRLVQTAFGMIQWTAHHVEFDVSRDTEQPYPGERMRLSLD